MAHQAPWDPMDFLDQRVQMALWDPMAPQVPKEKEVKKELWENPDPEDPMGCLASLVHEARRVM